MYCKHCGKQLDNDSKFCSGCGKPLSKSTSKKTGPSGLTIFIYGLLALACLMPMVYAEYRRLILGIPLDVTYWLLLLPILLSAFFLYRIIGAPAVAEERLKIEKEKEEGVYFKDDRIVKLVCNSLSVCCFIIAIFAFATSGILELLF